MKKIMVVGVGWEQVPLIQKAKKRGLYVVATTWWDKDKIPADKIYTADSRDLNMLENIMLEENPDYIIADECDYSMYAVAYLAQKYHLPGPSLGIQTITNNKFLQRECVKNSGVLQPEYCLCWDMDMGMEFAAQIGYPVMIKPLDNRGSIGVSKVRVQKDFEKAWLLAVEHSHSRLCIVEKCITGEVVTADGFCDSSGFEFIAASTKDMYENNDNVAKILYYPGKFSDYTRNRIKQSTELVAEAIGVKYGFVHIEFIIEEGTGDIYLVEIANRGGGVFISNIILEQITGIDYTGALLDLAMGQKVDVRCNQIYISKAMLYFLKLEGRVSLEKCRDKFMDNCRVIYANKYQKGTDVESKASAGRQGVIVFAGQDFDEMLLEGKRFEKKYCLGKEEVLIFKDELIKN